MIDEGTTCKASHRRNIVLLKGTLRFFYVRNQLNEDEHIFQRWQFGIFIGFPITLIFALESRDYRQGSKVAEHTDMFEPMYGGTFTYVLENAERGGELTCERFYIDSPRLKVYNATKYKHAVEAVEAGTRKVLLGTLQFAPWPVPPVRQALANLWG
jgi:hypothetical protein